MPTLAVSTYSFGPECTAKQGIDFAVQHGFRGLELGSWTLWPDVMSDTDVRTFRVRAAANGIDLSIHFIHRGVAPASHDSERRRSHLADLARTLDLARDIGARPIVVHPGPIDSPGVKPAAASENVRREAIENLVDFLSKGARMAEERGAVLCVENLTHMPGYVLQSYGELVEVVETVDSPAVQITLDIGHADLSDGIRPAVEAFSRHLRHVHMHDSNGSRDHFEVGKASLDLSEHLDFLEPYPFTLAIESRDESDPEGCVLRSRDRLRELLGSAAR
jgi:sugar phosphate isomerase/epimerase